MAWVAGMMEWEVSSPANNLLIAGGYVRIVQPQESPIQKLLLAEGGQSYVYEVVTSTAPEAVLLVEFEDLPQLQGTDYGFDINTNLGFSDGYQNLRTFLTTVLSWSVTPFTLTDPDGTSYAVRYWGGFETFREASGRSQKAGFWTGTLQCRKIL